MWHDNKQTQSFRAFCWYRWVSPLQQPPEIGYLTISNALQWRSQYGRIIQVATTTTTVSVENLLVG
ncbi:hypothetical protein LC607_06270 [Nostoc sp. CHAB 5824]|nr:hypothetical protein [Nostoc sp. CHAB 5824]